MSYELLPNALLPWYDEYARDLPWRGETDPYRVWLSETMLQQTRVDTVKAYYARFLAAFPTVSDLAAAGEEQVLKLWEGLGYYSRARNAHRAARIVAEGGGGFPGTAEGLRRLPGVGLYTAGAVASICYNQKEPALDGNVLRVVTRIMRDDGCIDEPAVKNRIAENLRRAYPERAGDFTQALMELGATVCLPNAAPLCGVCPAASFCRARVEGAIDRLPVRKAKRARKVQDITMLAVYANGGLILQKRPPGGLLRGLWQLPNVLAEADWAGAFERVFGVSAENCGLKETTTGQHIFTHIEWRVTCHTIDAPGFMRPAGFVCANAADLAAAYPLPTAFKKFIAT